MTIRSMIREMQREIATGDLLPERAAELLMKASALVGNVNDEIRVADVANANRLLVELEASEHANRARIKAETSEEYIRKREARDTLVLLQEMSRALKYFLKAKQDEYQMARHQ